MSDSRPVLLVGSVPLASASAVFELLGTKLGALVKRIPDGETGPRASWIGWQSALLNTVSALEVSQKYERAPNDWVHIYKLKPGAKDTLKFGPLGYAEAAKRSYREFEKLRSSGQIAAGTRFQVCMPTPLAIVYAFIEPESIPAVWPAYEAAMGREIEQIAAAIPARDLAFQWDIAVEPVFILGRPEQLARFPIAALVASIVRASAHVPAEAELGLHLCFGDTEQKHAIQADDLSMLVSFANPLVAGIPHPIAWVHVPFPPKQDNDAYIAPLKNLQLPRNTELYVGLVHHKDGLDGARQRVAATQRVVGQFGVATDCGLGRRAPDTLPGLIDLHRQVAALT